MLWEGVHEDQRQTQRRRKERVCRKGRCWYLWVEVSSRSDPRARRETVCTESVGGCRLRAGGDLRGRGKGSGGPVCSSARLSWIQSGMGMGEADSATLCGKNVGGRDICLGVPRYRREAVVPELCLRLLPRAQ